MRNDDDKDKSNINTYRRQVIIKADMIRGNLVL